MLIGIGHVLGRKGLSDSGSGWIGRKGLIGITRNSGNLFRIEQGGKRENLWPG